MSHRPPSRRPLRVPLVLALLATAGCSQLPRNWLAEPPRAFAPANHAGDARLPAAIRRVVVLPVFGGDLAPPESAAALDPVVLAALQQQELFEVVALSREECRRRFGAAELSSVAALPHGFFGRLAEDFGADGVLFTDLTIYRAYRPQLLGLRARLATVTGVRLVWSFDQVFAADNPGVIAAFRNEARAAQTGLVPGEPSESIPQSPSRFAAYAATAMFRTLPPR